MTLRNSICRESPVKGAGSSDTGNKERKGREEPDVMWLWKRQNPPEGVRGNVPFREKLCLES